MQASGKRGRGVHWDFLRLPEVATRSGLPKAAAFRILATLIAEGLVFQNAANGTYGFVALYLGIADVIPSGIGVRERTRAAMRANPDQVIHSVC